MGHLSSPLKNQTDILQNLWVYDDVLRGCTPLHENVSCTFFVNLSPPPILLLLSPSKKELYTITLFLQLPSKVFAYWIWHGRRAISCYSNFRPNKYFVYHNFKASISWHGLDSVKFCCCTPRSRMPLISPLYSFHGLTGILQRPSQSISQQIKELCS